MSIALLVPVMLGVMSVFQATLNRQIAREWGLAAVALLNTVVVLALSLGFLAYCLLRGSESGLLRVSFDASLLRSWWLLPGCFGCALVLGLPWAVERLGALQVFVGLIGAQVVASAVWDHLAEGIPLSAPRGVGALLAVASVLLVNWR
jgi:bacterial/archaeal transporter family-2 protein